MSPWAVKRLDEFGGDISKFEVARLYPSKLRQVAIAKTEPGDENNQDISSLVGKVDIRKLEHFSQNDPDAYAFSGGLCRANQGPARIRRDVQGADTRSCTRCSPRHRKAITSAPRRSARSRSTARSWPIPTSRKWTVFKANKNNEAFLDRICVDHRSLLPQGERGDADLSQADRLLESRCRALRARDAGDAGQVLRHDAAQGARELQPHLQDARL